MEGIFFYIEYFSGLHGQIRFNMELDNSATISAIVEFNPEKYIKIFKQVFLNDPNSFQQTCNVFEHIVHFKVGAVNFNS